MLKDKTEISASRSHSVIVEDYILHVKVISQYIQVNYSISLFIIQLRLSHLLYKYTRIHPPYNQNLSSVNRTKWNKKKKMT